MFIFVRAVTYASLFIGLLLVYVPARLLSWFGMVRPAAIGAPQIIGMVVGAAGSVIALWCIFTFAAVGRGTPMPLDPPRRLVIRGPYRFVRKSLLYGADVPDNFLNCKGASVLKALTGGDPVTLEFKGSNERPEITCRFNAIVTCNSRLTVRLEGDAQAWRRRLVIVEYNKPKPDNVIADLSERILADEGPGVLNWMLEGLDKIRADGWQLRLTAKQQKIVDDLLLESEADVVFAKERLRKDGTESLTVAQCYEAYVQFCNERGWVTMAKKKFSNVIGDTVTRSYGLTVRHDISDGSGKLQRGWKGVGLA